MIMIVVTWVVPAILFFVSIFGWEHFVGKRDLLPGECMVQFLKDPVFNTSLIIGYYWIPLTIIIVLYCFIFHSAWTLSKKASDKEKERQKLLAALAKKPGSGTPQINKKATNTALGIAAVAMTSTFAPRNPSGNNSNESGCDTMKPKTGVDAEAKTKITVATTSDEIKAQSSCDNKQQPQKTGETCICHETTASNDDDTSKPSSASNGMYTYNN
jgi:hypothetical protein